MTDTPERAGGGTSKIRGHHLERAAYIYVRQSSLRQVRDHLESQRRQYERSQWAVAAGWSESQVVVIDDDQAKTASLPNARPGFQRLITAVASEEVGCVISLEGARLARNGPDWAQMLFLCRWTDTLIADEHGVYDLSNVSDRMLVGIRGEVNQLESDTSIQRMVAATWSKARHGELIRVPPAGYEIDDFGQLVCSPDEAVVEAVRTVFAKFAELGSARQVWLWFAEQGLKLPVRDLRRRSKPIEWRPPRTRNVWRCCTTRSTLGRMCSAAPRPSGGSIRMTRVVCRCGARRRDHHFAYLSWEEWLSVQDRLRSNTAMLPEERSPRGAAREGGALLQGLVRCGHCGRSMYVAFGGGGRTSKTRTPQYQCQGARAVGIGKGCQTVGSRRVDAFVVESFLDATDPASLEVARRVEELAVEEEAAERRLWQAQLEKAEYEAQRAQRQYDAVEPENRLVVRTLERAWNEKLAALEALRAQAAQARPSRNALSAEELRRVTELAEDLRAVWNAPTTTNRDRKQLLRCLVAEVQLHTEPDCHTVKIVWKGGQASERTLVRERGNRTRATDEDTVELIRKLAVELDDRQIAVVLNKQGRRTGHGNPFNRPRVSTLRATYGIPVCPPKPAPDPTVGPFTADEATDELGVSAATIYRWLREGLLPGTQITPGAPWKIYLTEEVRHRVAFGESPAGWVGLVEAARRLGVSKQLVAHKVKTGQLPAVRTKIGKRTCWRIDVSSATFGRQAELVYPKSNDEESDA